MIYLSVATSVDGYIDDGTTDRLVLSTQEDWAQVHALRAQADAIIIGAQTLRADDPRLIIKDSAAVESRLARGLSAQPARVVISGCGAIDPALRLFNSDGGRVVLFSNIERAELSAMGVEVVVKDHITAAFVATELEKRSMFNLFVEGGVQILDMFLEERVADVLRVAVNPEIKVSDCSAPQFVLPEWVEQYHVETAQFGAMQVAVYDLLQGACDDDKYLRMAIEQSRKCVAAEGSYSVGAVVVTAEGEVFAGFTHETSPTHHAEQEAIIKAEAAGVNLRGAAIYSSMEPCSKRSSEPESCSQIILRLGFARVVFALYEPSCFVECEGAMMLRKAGVKVSVLGHLAPLVREINGHHLG